MANDYKPLSEQLTAVFEVVTRNQVGPTVLVSREMMTTLIIRIAQLETALAVANNTVAILKGEQTFDDHDEWGDYIDETTGDEVMFNGYGQPVVETFEQKEERRKIAEQEELDKKLGQERYAKALDKRQAEIDEYIGPEYYGPFQEEPAFVVEED